MEGGGVGLIQRHEDTKADGLIRGFVTSCDNLGLFAPKLCRPIEQNMETQYTTLLILSLAFWMAQTASADLITPVGSSPTL